MARMPGYRQWARSPLSPDFGPEMRTALRSQNLDRKTAHEKQTALGCQIQHHCEGPSSKARAMGLLAAEAGFLSEKMSHSDPKIQRRKQSMTTAPRGPFYSNLQRMQEKHRESKNNDSFVANKQRTPLRRKCCTVTDARQEHTAASLKMTTTKNTENDH